MNEINVFLEGKEYQIDVQQAKKLGILKEKNSRCKSWEEFKLKYKNKRGYHNDSQTGEIHTPLYPIRIAEQLTQQEAIAIQAFSKLLKLRRDWIGDWGPDWSNMCIVKWSIERVKNDIQINKCYTVSKPFTFPTYEMAEEFLQCFEDLFVQCKNII
jgi:hypothetical protein